MGMPALYIDDTQLLMGDREVEVEKPAEPPLFEEEPVEDEPEEDPEEDFEEPIKEK